MTIMVIIHKILRILRIFLKIYNQDAQKETQVVKLDKDLTTESVQLVCENYKKLIKKSTGEDFPQDAKQLIY
jgi:multimeric flavodoxin WrbA